MVDQPTGAASRRNAEYVERAGLRVGELRKQHGLRFAPGYGQGALVGEVPAGAGVNTLDGYIARHKAGK